MVSRSYLDKMICKCYGTYVPAMRAHNFHSYIQQLLSVSQDSDKLDAQTPYCSRSIRCCTYLFTIRLTAISHVETLGPTTARIEEARAHCQLNTCPQRSRYTVIPSKRTRNPRFGVYPWEKNGPHEHKAYGADGDDCRRSAFGVLKVGRLPWRRR